MPLSTRLQVLKPSATLAISQRAAALRAEGKDVISFGVGEPDFETPSHIREAARRALDKGSSHYTAVGGIKPLREAIAKDSSSRRGASHTAEEVLVSVGAKHSLFNLSLALFDSGDEVIVPAPYWVSYPEQALLAQAKPVAVETRAEDNFCLSPSALEQALTPKTKALVLCSPSNPTGSAYSADALRALAEVLRNRKVWIIADEIYSRLVYDNFKHTSILDVAPDLKEQTVVVDGVSKTYAMTGWRIGWILAPKPLIAACDTIQSQSTTNPTAIAQYAALEAITGDQAPVEEMRKEFERRRNALVDGINRIEGLQCRTPQGAFYVFVDVRALLGKKVQDRVLSTDLEVADWWIDRAECAVVPGSAFGAPGFVRMSYATSMERIQEGLRRIAAAIAAVS